jgi:type II secretory pathway pseudopilin PulG
MALDAGWAGVIGAAIGIAGTLLAPVVTQWVQTRAESRLADKRRRRLLQLLSGAKYKWRSMATLAASIGADHPTTAALLIEIDARASLANGDHWALESRAPFPEDLQPDK